MSTVRSEAVRKSIPPFAFLGFIFFCADKSSGGSGFQKIVGLARAAKTVKLDEAVLPRGAVLDVR
jgi:hypothetical protein